MTTLEIANELRKRLEPHMVHEGPCQTHMLVEALEEAKKRGALEAAKLCETIVDWFDKEALYGDSHDVQIGELRDLIEPLRGKREVSDVV